MRGDYGQTPISHVLTNHTPIPAIGQLLPDRGADLSIRARVPGHWARFCCLPVFRNALS
jgi:hypothetical protein